jgi:hypothetical protein
MIEPVIVKEIIDKEKACLEWKGPYDEYHRPIFKLNGAYRLTKRVMYESWYGEVDQNMTVVNSCRNKNCVRPDHLEMKYYFYPETYARNGKKDPKNKRKRLVVKVTEKMMENAFRGIDNGRYKTISEIGEYLNVDNDDAIKFLHNDNWMYINNIYSKVKLDELRNKIFQKEKVIDYISKEDFIENILKNNNPF